MITKCVAAGLVVGQAALAPATPRPVPNEPACPAFAACAIALLTKALNEGPGDLAANVLNPTNVATTSTGWVLLNLTGLF
jgi:hypothetical protein